MPTDRRHPLTTFSFKVEITGIGNETAAFFQSVSGLSSSTDPEDVMEGGRNRGARKLVGTTSWGNIVLKRGFTGPGGLDLYKWYDKWTKLGDSGDCVKRASGVITQLNPSGVGLCKWTWSEGFPVKWEGPTLDATKSEIAIETLEIAHQGLTLEPLSPSK